MKFSVLLPTRDRLQYLKYAVETVRRQDYQDWEILISDNQSKEDVSSFVRSLGDPRIKCSRSDAFLPVTDNWNRALQLSSGDYLIMLGDDDGLMKGYFSRARALLEEFALPELVYSSGYLFAYPGVLPDHPQGLLHHYRNAKFLHRASEPFLLPPGRAARLVCDSLNFKMTFVYNMQYFLASRALVDRMLASGPLFQSPFPDYYAANLMFARARQILVDPEPTVAVGITAKSYGYYLFNNREAEGVHFLNGRRIKVEARARSRRLLPGTNMNTSWLLAMEALASNHGGEVNYGRYRRLQIVHVLRGRVDGTIPESVFRELWNEMRFAERLIYGIGLIFISGLLRVLGRRPKAVFRRLVRALEKRLRASNEWAPSSPARTYSNLLEVYEGVPAIARAARAGSSTF